MNKQQKIALIRQMLSGADLSESRCYILEVGEQPPTDYRRGVDRVIWVTDDKREIKTGKNDILVQVTSKETVQAVKKLGDYLDKVPDVGKMEVNTSCTRVHDLTSSFRRDDLTSSLRKDDLTSSLRNEDLQEPTPQPMEVQQEPTEVQQEPQQEPPPPPQNFIVFRDRGKFRNNRI